MVRPTQQTSTKRKRKSNVLIWARDGDHKNAQEHPCYLLENCNEEEGAPSNDEVWVEWVSNGTVACIPKSRISSGLSSRRRRVNNKDTKCPASNDNISKQKHVPSTKRSMSIGGKSISNNDSTTATLNDDRPPTIEQKKRRAPPRKRTNGGRLTALINKKLSKGNSINTKQSKKRAPPRKPPNWPSATNYYAKLVHATSTKRSVDGQSKPINSTDTSLTQNESSKDIPNYVLVEGCGITELNGTYNLADTDDKGAPVFCKRGKWMGNVTDYTIFRERNKLGNDYWYIGIFSLTPGTLGYLGHWYIGIRPNLTPSIRFYKAANNTERPPPDGWKVMGQGKEIQGRWGYGINPPPTLRYVYKTTDNIVSSSVSDETKVKMEDSTKVKEEMYGGETDDEKDRKIAAVPSLVSSSSQLTKSAYDEDTDDDVAPDPVQSTQLKVKEEEEDTDEEGTSPDPVESAQIKVKTEEAGEDTDDEDGKVAAVPSPIASTKVKSEQVNSYDMETDDEGSKLDAPTPVVSSQVKNKEDKSYDMDTDDDTLEAGSNNNIPTVSSKESDAHSSLPTNMENLIAAMEAEEQDKNALESKEEEEVVFVSCVKKKLTKEEEEKNQKSLALIQNEMLSQQNNQYQYHPLQSHHMLYPWQPPQFQHQLIQQSYPQYGCSHQQLQYHHQQPQHYQPIVNYLGQYNQSIQLPQVVHQSYPDPNRSSEERRRQVEDAEDRRKTREEAAKKKVKSAELRKTKQAGHQQLQRVSQVTDERRKKR